jgi:hypothetical protein
MIKRSKKMTIEKQKKNWKGEKKNSFLEKFYSLWITQCFAKSGNAAFE